MNIIGLILGVILFVAVGIPVAVSVIGTVNWTGFTEAQTVANLIPLLLAVGAIALVGYSVAGKT